MWLKDDLSHTGLGRCGAKPRIGGRRVFAQQIAPQGA